MNMDVTLEENDGVRFKTWEMDSQSRPPVNWTSDIIVTMCGWCNRVAAADSEGARKSWLAIEEAINHMQLMEGDNAPNLTHGICPECKSNFLKSIPSDKRLRF